MKLTCEREKLLHAFQTAAGVAPTRSPKPILQNVKLEASAETAMLMATDLEIGVRIEIPGIQVTAPGSVVLPKDRFGSLLRESSDEKLNLESDGAKARVWGTNSQFHFPTQNPDEFPAVQAFHESKYHEMPARFFRELIRRTAYATDTESSRYALGGVLMEMEPERINGVGTDGRRLARQEGPAKSVGGHVTMQNTIIPTRALQVMERALADNDGEIQITARDNDVLVKSQRTTIYTRLVEGRFPKWRDVFPRQEDSIKIEMCVGPFHAAVRQAAIVTSEERRGVDFTFGDGKVVLTGHGAEHGESQIELPVAYDGDTLPVKLDPRFVSDFLRVLDADATFIFQIRDSESAVVCSTGDGYAYVIMPLSRES